MALEDLTVKKRKKIADAIRYSKRMEKETQDAINSLKTALGIINKEERPGKKRDDMTERELEQRRKYLQSQEHKTNLEDAKGYRANLERATAEYNEYRNRRERIELYIRNGCNGKIPELEEINSK